MQNAISERNQTGPPQPEGGLTWSFAGAICVCVIICLAAMFWIKDAPWGGDDSSLIHGALQANHEHRLATIGLQGSFGDRYGPIPTQIYQGLLLLTHDLTTLIRIHVLIFGGITAAALLWLTRLLKWSPWLVPMSMVSPFFYNYERMLWDNTFAIPIGALMVAAYICFHTRNSRAAFITAMACAAVQPFIHPMTLPLVGAVGIHVLWHHRSALRRNAVILVGIALVTVAICAPYCMTVARLLPKDFQHFTRMLHKQRVVLTAVITTPKDSRPAPVMVEKPLPRRRALAYPLFAGRELSAYYFFDGHHKPGDESGALPHVAAWISNLAFPIAWIGMIVCIARLRAGWRGDSEPADLLAAIAILSLAFQALMDCALQVSPWPHYFNGTWISCIACLWLGIHWLSRFRVWRISAGSILAVAYSLATALATVALASIAHRSASATHGFDTRIGPDPPPLVLQNFPTDQGK